MEALLTPTLFFTIAMLYAAVGFGGGSSYLAILALLSFPYEHMPIIALACNLIVVTGSLYHHLTHRLLVWKKAWPLVMLSVPLAYVGGLVSIPKNVFLILLAFSLTIAGFRLIFFHEENLTHPKPENQNIPIVLGLGLGAALGLISGMVGIGGGIFLAPLLYLLNWGSSKQIAAMSSLFIFVNSLSGMWGQYTKLAAGTFDHVVLLKTFLPLGLAVLIGGQIGSLFCVGKLKAAHLRRLTAILTLWVSFKIFWDVL